MQKLSKKGVQIKPVVVKGTKIAKTFWGAAWCNHLESFSDYENRLPRGRTYVRNGSVCHLDIRSGAVEAMVSGSTMYTVNISIKPLSVRSWEALKRKCSGRIASLLELLQGRLSEHVMSVVTDRDGGLFPLPREIEMHCSCPDWAVMCKHVAAVLYGVGARLDEEPELLFLLRGVDHEELISAELEAVENAGTVGIRGGAGTSSKPGGRSRRRISADSISEVFDIDLDGAKADAGEKAAARESAGATSDAAGAAAARKTVGTAGAPESARATPAAARQSTGAAKTPALTGKAVRRLRARLGVTQAQLARLLSVSTGSVANWEKQPGPLKLQARTREALVAARGLSSKEARAKLSGQLDGW